MTVNKAILIGNLGRDPESRTTTHGTTITSLRIATTERRKNQDDEWSDHTEWHSVVCFGRQAESAAKYLEKGRQVYVEGRIQTRKWQTKEGQDRWTTEVVADTVRFLGRADGRPEARTQAPARNQYRHDERGDTSDPDDMPF